VKLALALAVLAGCGTPPPEWTVDASACAPYVVPSTEDLMAPVQMFAADVVPLLTAHCAGCHGTTGSPSGNLFLGATAGDAGAVYANLVQPSGELAGMPFITPSDPARSFLMHKLDGDQCQYDAMCGGGSCDLGMPMSGGMLSVVDRDTIRRWIAQGAAND